MDGWNTSYLSYWVVETAYFQGRIAFFVSGSVDVTSRHWLVDGFPSNFGTSENLPQHQLGTAEMDPSRQQKGPETKRQGEEREVIHTRWW